jgi:hypothetical protein
MEIKLLIHCILHPKWYKMSNSLSEFIIRKRKQLGINKLKLSKRTDLKQSDGFEKATLNGRKIKIVYNNKVVILRLTAKIIKNHN